MVPEVLSKFILFIAGPIPDFPPVPGSWNDHPYLFHDLNLFFPWCPGAPCPKLPFHPFHFVHYLKDNDRFFFLYLLPVQACCDRLSAFRACRFFIMLPSCFCPALMTADRTGIIRPALFPLHKQIFLWKYSCSQPFFQIFRKNRYLVHHLFNPVSLFLQGIHIFFLINAGLIVIKPFSQIISCCLFVFLRVPVPVSCLVIAFPAFHRSFSHADPC